MKKRILSLILAAGLSASVWSCGGNDSSSESESTAAETTEAASAIVTPGEKYSTETGDFTFTMPADAKVSDQSLELDCEYSFTLGNDALAGVTTVLALHQSAAGFGEGLLKDMEDTDFKDCKGEENTVGDAPAYTITAKQTVQGEDADYRMDIVQFGNGDLFTLVSGAPLGELESYRDDINFILGSVEYSGEPLKTQPEEYDCSYFTATVGENFYVKSMNSSESAMDVRYNIQPDFASTLCGFNLKADERSADEIKEDLLSKWKDSSETESFSEEDSEYLGYPAVHLVKTVNSSFAKLNVDWYIFEVNGTVFTSCISSDQSITEKFTADIQPLIDSIRFK